MRDPRRRRFAALALSLACLCACAAGQRRPSSVAALVAPAGAPPELVARVRALRVEAKTLIAAQSELYWRNWVYGDPVDVAATYRGHEALFGQAAIADVGRLRDLTDQPDERRALGYFRLYLLGEAVGRAVAPLADQALTLEADATFVTPGGVEQPYRELDQLLANEVSYAQRGQLSDAALAVVRKLDPILKEKDAVARRALEALGTTPAKYAAELRQADPAALAALANGLLDATEVLYRRSMDSAVHAELGLGLAGMRRADIPRFDRSPPLDAWFPAEKMLPTLRSTLAGLGLDLAKQPDLRIDDAPLPKKDPRAICLPIEVPGDVRLSVKPQTGVPSYQAFFHEAGHAEHYAHTTTQRFELQLLGDGTVGEAYAFLFEGLIENPRWLAEKVGLPGDRATALARNGAVRELYLLRRLAGKLLFELGREQAAADPESLYRRTLSRAYAFALSAGDAERWRVDEDDFLYGADNFRARFLTAQLEVWLEKRFGESWWDAPKAGAALEELWRHGTALGPDEIAREIGDSRVKPEPLLAKLKSELAP